MIDPVFDIMTAPTQTVLAQTTSPQTPPPVRGCCCRVFEWIGSGICSIFQGIINLISAIFDGIVGIFRYMCCPLQPSPPASTSASIHESTTASTAASSAVSTAASTPENTNRAEPRRRPPTPTTAATPQPPRVTTTQPQPATTTRAPSPQPQPTISTPATTTTTTTRTSTPPPQPTRPTAPRPQINYQQDAETIIRSLSKGNCLTRGFTIDWNDNNNPRFLDARLRSICANPEDPIWALAASTDAARNYPRTAIINRDEGHASPTEEAAIAAWKRAVEADPAIDGTWPNVGAEFGGIRTFFRRLVANDALSNLTQREKVKKMVCILLNALEEIQSLDDTRNANQQRYSGVATATFAQLSRDALANCTNNLMPTLDDIVTGLVGGSTEGRIKLRVETALQSIRMACFNRAVYNIIQRLPTGDQRGQRGFHSLHEASTRNYYLRTMFERYGLKDPVNDTNYESFAYTGQEQAVQAEFERIYTVKAIVDGVTSIVNNPGDGSIPSNLFTNWARGVEPQGPARVVLDDRTSNVVITDPSSGNPVLDASNNPLPMQNAQRHFDKRLVIEYLLDTGILRR